MRTQLAAWALIVAWAPLMFEGQQVQTQVQNGPAAPNPLYPFAQNAPVPDAEASDFTHAVQQASGGPLDFTRAFEEFLQKQPQSSRREQIVRALFRASKDRKDQVRIALYGEELLKKDPDDISLLEPVGEALNALEDPKAATRALALGQRLEHDLQQNGEGQTTPGETPHEKGKRLFEHAKMLSAAYTIQADALGILGKYDQACTMAGKGFDALPSADAARCLGRWSAKEGHYDTAVSAYAEAFAITDTPENHRDDRTKMTELYRKTHADEKGLGDIVLAAYDQMTALNDQRMEVFGNTPATKPIDFQLASLDGNRLPLLSLKGKVIVMDFWATWCNPCRVQHPLFEEVKNKFKDNRGVVFLEVDSGEPKETVAHFVNQYAWNQGVYLDDGLTQALKIENLPTTVLLGHTGEVYSLMAGFNPANFVDILSSKIEDALKATGSAPPMRMQGN